MTISIFMAATIFTLLGGAGAFLVVLGLPGVWILLAVAAVIELLDRLWLGPGVSTFGWWWIAAGVSLATLGELVEIGSGMLGVKTAGGSRRSMFGAFIGGMVGGIVGTAFMPIIGTLLGAFGGTFVGALVGEMYARDTNEWRDAVGTALGATIARVVGTFTKMGVAVVVWVTLSVLAFWP